MSAEEGVFKNWRSFTSRGKAGIWVREPPSSQIETVVVRDNLVFRQREVHELAESRP